MNEHGDDVTLHERGYLPHWVRDGAVYFVTFRLADALPRHVAEQLTAEREWMEQRIGKDESATSQQEREEMRRDLVYRVEKYLDAGAGSCALKRAELADLVADALAHFDGVRYQLICWCIMPNHVHAVVQPWKGYSLASILHSWKSFTATAANRLLKSSGEFWQREYYDRCIRDERHLVRVIQYVVNNPAKANLRDWRWVGVSQAALEQLNSRS